MCAGSKSSHEANALLFSFQKLQKLYQLDSGDTNCLELNRLSRVF